jgi:hypothetical protein
MAKKRRAAHKAARDSQWTNCKEELLARVRATFGLGGAIVPDEVLLAEVDHYLPTHALSGAPLYSRDLRTQWFGWRLLGFGEGEFERTWLADFLDQEWRGVGPIPELMKPGPPRRSELAGEQRRLRTS